MDANGERMGGTTGAVISVRKIVNDLRASNALVVWDGEGGSQRRKGIFKEYKAGRTVRLNRTDDDMEEDPAKQLENLRKQINLTREYLTILGVPQVRPAGVEADDVMAYLAQELEEQDGIVVVTTDQDLLQVIREKGQEHTIECRQRNEKFRNRPSGLPPITVESLRADGYKEPEKIIAAYAAKPIRPEYFGLVCDCTTRSEVKVWSPVKHIMYDRTKFISDYGVLPENFRLVKAMTGDSSDNIGGIKGLGTKTVVKLFPFLSERRASAEDVLDAAEAIKGVVGKRLIEQKVRFLENLSLVDLSQPMLSATAARQSRNALRRDLGCREVEFRVRCVRDGISFGGDNFVGPFRDLTLRRRRLAVDRGWDTSAPDETDDTETTPSE